MTDNITHEWAADGSGVDVGDLIKISVELIRDLATQPDFSTQVVRLREVRRQHDGTKILVLDVVDR